MPGYIKYFTDEYSNLTEVFGTYDAIAHISSKLAELELKYIDDYELDSVDYEDNGRQVITIKFASEKNAMLIKLKGLHNGR
jgi:hypothetical protein|tara:strand:+ start:4386 stop:4628 length:243 start_codon:yes stop_codon:yes gene_type:complete